MTNITIQEQQLATWANRVQLNKNTATYDKVKDIFRGVCFNNSNNFEIYLQGSVANNTNIWADGDIDIILQFNETFYYNYNYNPSIYNNPSSYTQEALRNEIKSVLNRERISYKEKNKCIELHLRGEHWQNVDLVPCFQYKNHYDRGEKQYYEGIKIQSSKGEIINYPKIHKQNGEEKNSRTGNYKKMVRIFKNIKRQMIKENWIDESLAPSYFVECLIYNVPNDKFNESYFTSLLANCLNWLRDNDLKNLKCQNEIQPLFGDESTKWNLTDCHQFLKKVIEYVTG